MSSSTRLLFFVFLNLVVVIAAGCGGGGGPSSGAGAAPANAQKVTGVAATGAPIVSGIIYLKDSSATPIERHQSTRSDGSFTFDASDLAPPFFLKINGNNQNLYSIATGFGITNITPLTTIVVAQAAQRDDLDALYTSYSPAGLSSIAQQMSAADTKIQHMFASLMATFHVTGSLVNSQFSANGTGPDALLDAISVSVSPGAITVKQGTSTLLNVAANQLSSAVMSPSPTTPSVPTAGSVLYTTKCAGCHGVSASSDLIGIITVSSVQSAIGSNLGGMGMLSGLSAADIQAVTSHLTTSVPVTPVPPPTIPAPATPADGAALYASECAGCHGSLAASDKKGTTVVRLNNAIGGNIGGMGFLSGLTAADVQAMVAVLNPVTPTPTPTPTPISDGPLLYSANCAGCHGPLASSSKQGITIARLQSSIASNTGNMGYLSSLSVSDVQALVTVLTPATPTPTPTPTPVVDGPTLYGSNCASCHGTLASSDKAGATASRIQTAINGNIGSMGSLSVLSTVQVAAIETALSTVTPSPTPAPACGSCHGIPPSTGRHSKHLSKGVGCVTCHGSGYSSTSFNLSSTNLRLFQPGMTYYDLCL